MSSYPRGRQVASTKVASNQLNFDQICQQSAENSSGAFNFEIGSLSLAHDKQYYSNTNEMMEKIRQDMAQQDQDKEEYHS